MEMFEACLSKIDDPRRRSRTAELLNWVRNI